MEKKTTGNPVKSDLAPVVDRVRRSTRLDLPFTSVYCGWTRVHHPSRRQVRSESQFQWTNMIILRIIIATIFLQFSDKKRTLQDSWNGSGEIRISFPPCRQVATLRDDRWGSLLLRNNRLSIVREESIKSTRGASGSRSSLPVPPSSSKGYTIRGSSSNTWQDVVRSTTTSFSTVTEPRVRVIRSFSRYIYIYKKDNFGKSSILSSRRKIRFRFSNEGVITKRKSSLTDSKDYYESFQ